jgi:hypothetical protein
VQLRLEQVFQQKFRAWPAALPGGAKSYKMLFCRAPGTMCSGHGMPAASHGSTAWMCFPCTRWPTVSCGAARTMIGCGRSQDGDRRNFARSMEGACWGTSSMLSQCVVVQSQRHTSLSYFYMCFVRHMGVRISSIHRSVGYCHPQRTLLGRLRRIALCLPPVCGNDFVTAVAGALCGMI